MRNGLLAALGTSQTPILQAFSPCSLCGGDTRSRQKRRLFKTCLGILESEHSLLQCWMHGRYFLLTCIPRIEAGILLFNFLSISFSPRGSPMVPIDCTIYRTLGQHFHTAHAQGGRVRGPFPQEV